MPIRRSQCLPRIVTVLGLLAGAPLAAQTPTPAPFRFTASVRTRLEAWNWFDSTPAGRYPYVGVIARAGVVWQQGTLGARVEMAAPALLGLPDDAVAPAPAGQLGLGPTYFVSSDSSRTVAHLFPKQAYFELGRATGHRLRLGRTEFSDGMETTPKSPTLLALKRERVGQRLIGPFGWSHVGRSFDGGMYTYAGPRVTVTALAARATRGAFDVNGWNELSVGLGYLSISGPAPWSRSGSDARLFAIYYRDDRSLPKVDARPAAVRALDSSAVAIVTLGGHLVEEVPTSIGPVDLLAWGAWQTGDWGLQSHRAGAVALEAGVQPHGLAALRPWLRAGVYYASGDDDPADGRHGTFFGVLPTPRVYARFPFYSTPNLEEAFGSILLRPGALVTMRADLRFLGLADRADLWYGGGGAYEAETFGYAGRPSGGARALATLVDLSAEWRTTPHLTVTVYGAYAHGRDVVRATYPGDARGAFGYLEAEWRR